MSFREIEEKDFFVETLGKSQNNHTQKYKKNRKNEMKI